MGDSQANNDHLAGRLRNLQQESARGKEAKVDPPSFGQRSKAFIRDHAREEKDNLMRLLGERIQEVNASADSSPQFVMQGSYSVQLGNAILHLEFDQVPSNPDDYVLVLKIGLAPFKKPLGGSEPTAKRDALRAIASDDLSSVQWGWPDQGRSTSEKLVVDALDMLIDYARKHNLI